MKYLLISGHRNGALINLWLRGEDNKKHRITINDFKPYFYISNDYGEFNGIYGESLTKIFVKDPSDVPKERMRYTKTWEADIPFVRRYLIDSGISKGLEFDGDGKYLSKNNVRPSEVDIDPVILYLDIEIKPTDKGFPTPEKAEHPVVSFSFTTNKTNKYFTYIWRDGLRHEMISQNGNNITICLEDEKSLLVHFSDVINRVQPDIITGWNIINFDMEYLRNRFKRLELRWLDERPFKLFDLLGGYKKIFSQPSYALKRVAEIEEIADKENIETFKEVSGYYETDIKRFIEYNRKDVEYVKKIDEKQSLIEYYLNFKWLVGLEDIQKTTINSVLIDTLLLRIAKERDICLPTTKRQEKREKYEGAYVMVEKAGLYQDIGVFDFKSYYPYLIISFNLSPEIEDGNSKEGIIPYLLRSMLTEKEKIGDEMKKLNPGTVKYKALHNRKEATKRVINTVYGVTAYSGFRLYKPKIAEKTTKYGREGIQYLISLGEKYGFRVLLADTDSIFAQVPFAKAEELCYTLGDEAHKFFSEKYGVKMNLTLEFEKYIQQLLLTGVKKRYAMRVTYAGWECDYIETKGFENIRTDQSLFTRNLLSELFKLILYGGEKNEIRKFVHDKLEEFPKRPINEIAISRGINKPFDQYKANVAAVRGAIYSNHHFNTNFGHGSKIMMIWCKGIEGYPPTNVVCFDEDTILPDGLIIDWKHMKRVCIEDKVKHILEAINIDLGSSGKQLTLG